MDKTWSEVEISSELHNQMKTNGQLSAFEDYVYNKLVNVIGIKLGENGISMTDEIKSKIQYSKKLGANGYMTYRAVVYVPEKHRH